MEERKALRSSTFKSRVCKDHRRWLREREREGDEEAKRGEDSTTKMWLIVPEATRMPNKIKENVVWIND